MEGARRAARLGFSGGIDEMRAGAGCKTLPPPASLARLETSETLYKIKYRPLGPGAQAWYAISHWLCHQSWYATSLQPGAAGTVSHLPKHFASLSTQAAQAHKRQFHLGASAPSGGAGAL